MALELTVLGRSTPLEGITLTMSGATVLDMGAGPMICAGVGGAKDSVTYFNIPGSGMHKVHILQDWMEADGGGENVIVQVCMRDVVQHEQGKLPSFSKLFLFKSRLPAVTNLIWLAELSPYLRVYAPPYPSNTLRSHAVEQRLFAIAYRVPHTP